MRTTNMSVWHRSLPAPLLQAEVGRASRAQIAHFHGIDPEIQQPELSEHVVSIHLGGPKRMRRWHAGRMTVHDIAEGSITVMPAFEANRWLTEGPVAFAHLAISTGAVAEFVAIELDREPRNAALVNKVGQSDPFLAQVYRALLRETAEHFGGALYTEALMTALLVGLLNRHSSLSGSSAPTRTPSLRGGLAGWQLRRVIDFLHEHLEDDITSAHLVALTGLGRAQFFLAFKQSTGVTPRAYLDRLRLRHADALLVSDLPMNDIARAVGQGDELRLARWYKRHTGCSATDLRRSASRQASKIGDL